MTLYYKVENNDLSVNTILKNKLQISSRLLSKLIKNKLVSLNGKTCDTRTYVHIGDIISIDFNNFEDNSNIIPLDMKLDIIYEDDWLLILNKPSGIAVHPSILHFDDTLSNGVKFYFDKINLPKKIRPVNRLDFNTSGLIVFAKNEYMQECLIQQMAVSTFQKEYIALISGILDEKKGTIDKPIARKPGSIIERCISPGGKKSVTHFEVLKEFENGSLVKCRLETGRTHQIRVHFASIGHPLVGDTLYGGKSDSMEHYYLVCYKLDFIHPVSKEPLSFELPKNLLKFV